MDGTIDVPIPLDPEAARALADPDRREAAGRYLSGLLAVGGARLAALAECHRDIKANGVTDEMVDEELAIWRAERSANCSARR